MAPLAQDLVPELGAVSCDVADAPERLLGDEGLVGVEEFDERGYAPLFYDGLALGVRARCDVGDDPAGLELQLRPLVVAHEVQQRGDDAAVDHLLDALPALLLGYYLADRDHCLVPAHHLRRLHSRKVAAQCACVVVRRGCAE